MKRVAALAGVVVVAVLLLFVTGYLRLHYPSMSRYPVRGIDVSHHQGEIDWTLFDHDDVAFAYIKATEGKDFRDTRFEDNWQAAGRAGIPRGAYHFFTFCSPGELQAEHLLNVVPTDEETLPLAVDIEFAGNCKNWSSIDDIRAELNAFLDRLAASGARPPILYVTRQSYGRIVAGQFNSHMLWIRGVYRKPALVPGQEWLFWQFADRGKLAGVDGFVDLNVFRGARSELVALLASDGPQRPVALPPAGGSSDE